jgi:hypothetical protein
MGGRVTGFCVSARDKGAVWSTDTVTCLSCCFLGHAAASFGAFRGAYRLSSRRNGWNFTSDGGGSSVVAQKPPAGPADVGRSSKMQPTKVSSSQCSQFKAAALKD